MDLDSEKTRPHKRRTWLRLAIAFVLLSAVLLVFGPWIISKTPLRDFLFATLVNDPDFNVTSDDASLYYFSPLSINGLDIIADDGETRIQVHEIQAEKSWLAMLLERPELGSFTFVKPDISVTVTELGNQSRPVKSEHKLLPTLTAVIKEASVRVNEPAIDAPAVDLKNVNVTLHVQRNNQVSVVVVDPVTVFDHHVLTPEICNQGLQLVAPLLADQIDAEGEFSFQLQRCRVPIGGSGDTSELAAEIDLAGVVQLHQASVAMKDSLARQLVQMIARLLATEVPERLKVVEKTDVIFHVVDGRVHHEGFAMVLPYRDSSVELRTSGFVGLDNSLDIRVEMGLAAAALGDSELARYLSSKPLRIQVTGSIGEPIIELAPDKDWLERIQELLASDEAVEGAAELVERTTDLLGEWLQNRPAPEERLLPRLRDRLRQRRERLWNGRTDEDE